MTENRRNFRLRKQLDLTWSIPEQNIEGEGLIYNISLTGVLFVTDRMFEPKRGLEMCLSVTEVPVFPSKGDLAWFRKVGQAGDRYQCGVQFSKEDAHNQVWVKWVEDTISKLGEAGNNNILGGYM